MDKMNGTALCEAVSNIDLARVTQLLDSGHCANGVRDPGGEEDFQPDRPLKMVMFRLSDCLSDAGCCSSLPEQRATLAEIAKVLLRHGADPTPAMNIAERRYGKYSKEENEQTWKAWSVVAEAAEAAKEHAGVL